MSSTSGRFTIKDLHPLRRPLSVAEIFLHSSNVGAAKLALLAGPQRFQDFLRHMQLLDVDEDGGGRRCRRRRFRNAGARSRPSPPPTATA